MTNKITNYFSMISLMAKIAWLFLGAAKICGLFAIIVTCIPEYRMLVRIFLPLWIIFLLIAVVLALKSRKYEPEMKEWWRYYIP